MPLKSHPFCAVVLAGSVTACQPKVEQDPTWLLGVFNDGGPGLAQQWENAHVNLYEFLEDGRAVKKAAGCGASTEAKVEDQGEWSVSGDDAIDVYWEKGGVSSHWSVRSDGCQADVERYAVTWYRSDGSPRDAEWHLYRGAKCLEALPDQCAHDEDSDGCGEYGPLCDVVWCDEPPPPCVQ